MISYRAKEEHWNDRLDFDGDRAGTDRDADTPHVIDLWRGHRREPELTMTDGRSMYSDRIVFHSVNASLQ
jgi:hypothetical protein